mgnify:CR=1 FL=1
MNKEYLRYKFKNMKFRMYCWLSRNLGYKVINVSDNLKHFDEQYKNRKKGDKRKSDVDVINISDMRNIFGINTDRYVVIDEGVNEEVIKCIVRYFGWDRIIMWFK